MNTTTIAALTELHFGQHESDGILTVMPDQGIAGLGISIRRVFTISDVPAGGVRGDHAHRYCTQVVVCLQGSVSIDVDDGRDKVTMILGSASVGLSIPPGLWNRLTFAGPGTVLAVFCDQPYDPADYLRDRAEFKRFKGQ